MNGENAYKAKYDNLKLAYIGMEAIYKEIELNSEHISFLKILKGIKNLADCFKDVEVQLGEKAIDTRSRLMQLIKMNQGDASAKAFENLLDKE